MSKKNNRTYEYLPEDGMSKIFLIITFCLTIFLFTQLLESHSILYGVLFFCSFFCFVSLFNAILINQRVLIRKNKITFLYRIKPPLTGKVANTLYQIVTKKGQIIHFRFSFDYGQKRAQVSPQGYKNGDKLSSQLKTLIKQEKIIAEIIEK